MKIDTFKTLINFYNEKAYTHKYIFVFNYKGTVYMVKTTSEMLAAVLSLDKASRGAGYSIRFKPNRKIKEMLLTLNATPICSVDLFDEMVAESKYNKGEIAEKLITEYFGQTWEKDNVPFTEDGDLTVDGVAYQIKYERATFINEAQMMRMRAEA